MSSGIKIATSTDCVEIRVDGELIASSDRPVTLDEGALPRRYYLPRADVRMELLQPNEHASVCPLKGTASYVSLELNGKRVDNIAWSYENPIADAEAIRGMLCFYPHLVEMTVTPR